MRTQAAISDLRSQISTYAALRATLRLLSGAKLIHMRPKAAIGRTMAYPYPNYGANMAPYVIN